MTDTRSYREIGVSRDGFVATVEMRRPPHNFFDSALVAEIGDAFEQLDADPDIRAIVFAAEGRSFCAGADFSKRMDTGTVAEGTRSAAGRHLYKEAIRLFRTRKPIVAAVHGAAVGGGLGLALVAGFSRHLSGGAVQRQFQPARLSSRLWLDRDSAAACRRTAGGVAVLYRPAHSRRRSGGIGLADLLVPQAEVRAPPRHWRSKSRNRRRSRSCRRAKRCAAG